MASVADLVALGYTVGVASEGVLYVAGFGISTYMAADDDEQIASLADPALHAERIAEEETTVASAAKPLAVQELDPSTATLEEVVAAVNSLSGF